MSNVNFENRPTVRELLETIPAIDESLDNSDHFWTRIKDNTIPNSELLKYIAAGQADQLKHTAEGALFYNMPAHISVSMLAGLLILHFREEGILETPTEQSQK